MTKSLLEGGKHNITALTRAGSESKFPSGVKAVTIDYEDQSSIVTALRGQDALVLTLSTRAPKGIQDKLVEAAAEAGVPWVLPNDWSPDTAHEAFLKEIAGFQDKAPIREKIKNSGKCSYLAICCGFWYEWSLSIPMSYGIDSIKQEAVLFDDGDQKITTSTWPQVGRAVAALLSLPIKAEGGDKKHCLEHFKNSHVYIGSFTVSQNDMLESCFRVTDTKKSDWKITNEPSKDRYEKGGKAMREGDMTGFVKQMYTRVFFPDGAGNHEKTHGLDNEVLGLPKEDLDEATRAAIKRQKETPAWGS